VLHRWQYGSGFESAGYSLFLSEYGRSVGHPVITGDCVSPVLARVCGMHLGYYDVPSNWAKGLRPQNLTDTLDTLYLETLPEVAAALELRLLARLATLTECRCRQLLRPAARRVPSGAQSTSRVRRGRDRRSTGPARWRLRQSRHAPARWPRRRLLPAASNCALTIPRRADRPLPSLRRQPEPPRTPRRPGVTQRPKAST
jgi:hypothetical protein